MGFLIVGRILFFEMGKMKKGVTKLRSSFDFVEGVLFSTSMKAIKGQIFLLIKNKIGSGKLRNSLSQSSKNCFVSLNNHERLWRFSTSKFSQIKKKI